MRGGERSVGPSGARVVGVVGASGGIGTSCLAAALATRAAMAGQTVVCADADPGGGGLDALFDLESRPGIRWPDLMGVRGHLDGAMLLGHLPESAQGVAVLSAAGVDAGPVPPIKRADDGSPDVATDLDPDAAIADRQAHPGTAVPRVVVSALAAAVDTMVLDLGGVASLGRGSLIGAQACGDLVLVVGASVPALARAGRAASALTAADTERVWLAQRCPRGRADLADLVTEHLGLPLLGVILDDPRLDAALVRGVAPGSSRSRIGDAADSMWRALARQERAA